MKTIITTIITAVCLPKISCIMKWRVSYNEGMLVFLIGYLRPEIIGQEAEKSSKLAMRICRLQKFEKKTWNSCHKNFAENFFVQFFLSLCQKIS